MLGPIKTHTTFAEAMMRLFNKSFGTLEDLFIEQIEDLYDAEKRLTTAIPKMAEAAHARKLKEALNVHLAETEGQVERLEQIFQQLGKEPRREACAGMKGLVAEGSEMMNASGDDDVRDAAIIAAAQRVEHYEMAGYGTARALAEHLGHRQAAGLLQKTLDEEKHADEKLTAIAEDALYPRKNGRKRTTSTAKRRTPAAPKARGSRSRGRTQRKRAAATAR
jgi:ferritin-like metal-binding protein YciE